MKTRFKLPAGAEVRFAPGVEYRKKDDGSAMLRGHPATFLDPYDMGDFHEQVAPEAFDDALMPDADVRALWNHDSAIVLGRTKSGTLRLSKSTTALASEIDLPKSATAQREAVERGDVDQMSFAFRVVDEEWDHDAEPPLRTLKRVELLEVSPVTFPANPNTDVALRSLRRSRESNGTPGRGRASSIEEARRLLDNLETEPAETTYDGPRTIEEARRRIERASEPKPKPARDISEHDRLARLRWITALHEAAHCVLAVLDGKRVKRASVWSEGGRVRGGTCFEDPEHVGRDVQLAGLAAETVFLGVHDTPDAVASSRSDLVRASCQPGSAPAGLSIVEDRVRAYTEPIYTLARALEQQGSLDGSEVERIVLEALGPDVRRGLMERRLRHRHAIELAHRSQVTPCTRHPIPR